MATVSRATPAAAVAPAHSAAKAARSQRGAPHGSTGASALLASASSELAPPPRAATELGSLQRRAAALVDAALTGTTLDFGRPVVLRPPALPLDTATLDQCGRELEARGVAVRTLRLAGWRRPVDTALRALSLRVAEGVTALDVSSSLVDRQAMEVVRARFWSLRSIDLSGCTMVDDACIRSVVGCANRTLESLNISACPALSVDSIGWLAGALGEANAPRCRRLRTLRAARNPSLDDRAWLYLRSGGLAGLESLDVSDLESLTDDGVAHIVAGCRRLRVLDLRHCGRLTDDSARAVSHRCSRLRSIALTRLEWLSDTGLWHIAQGCRALQTIDVAGCPQVTELGLFFLAVRCPALQRLRADGDPLVTARGLSNLARGIGRGLVEPATKWHGLKPAPGGALLRLERQYGRLRGEAASTVQRAVRCWRARQLTERMRRLRDLAAVSADAAAVGRQRLSEWEAASAQQRQLQLDASLLLTVRAKHLVARARARRSRQRQAVEEAAGQVLNRIKARHRAHATRLHQRRVFEAILLQRRARRAEAAAVAALGMQSILREYRAHAVLGSLRWELFKRRADLEDAALAVQCAWRGWIARQRAAARALALEEFAAAVEALARIAQRVYRGHVGRRWAAWVRAFGAPVVRGWVHRSAALIQALYRGMVGRRYAEEVRRGAEMRHMAASRVQRVWRGSRVQGWREIALDRVRTMVRRGRAAREAEGRAAMRRTRMRQRGAADQDSASDEPSEDDWEPFWDEAAGAQRWYSAARDATSLRRPQWALERRLVAEQAPVLVYWPLSRRSFQGRFVRWVPSKLKFKVEYDDGDVEYLAAHQDHKRVQVRWAGGAWVPFAALPHGEWRPPARHADQPGRAARRSSARPAGLYGLVAEVDADAAGQRARADA
ncbi:FBXL20 [Symbiodinium sp. KB8]|nr:FBXL20 [Symbiodinium sp. KB8]